MKGLTDSGVVYAAARVSVAFWEAEFEAKKERWIAEVAATRRQWLWFKGAVYGRMEAEKRFYYSSFYHSGPCGERVGSGGRSKRLWNVAAVLALRTEHGEPRQIVLSSEDVDALEPGFAKLNPRAPGDYRCTRCGRTAADAKANGCDRGPCPMEVPYRD